MISHFIRVVDSYMQIRLIKAREKLAKKSKGFATVEMAILLFIAVVLAAVFWKYIKDITNTAMGGAQDQADELFK